LREIEQMSHIYAPHTAPNNFLLYNDSAETQHQSIAATAAQGFEPSGSVKRSNHFIAYSSVMTGSTQLRCLNVYLQKAMYGERADVMETAFAQYCKLYDGSKKDEPFYDGILTAMATLEHETFNKNFSLIPVELTEQMGEDGPDHFLAMQAGTRIFTMTPKPDWEEPGEHRALIYNGAQHVFLLGPITDAVLHEVRDLLKSPTKIVFHFQGESQVEGFRGSKFKERNPVEFYGMNAKGNLFANAFNYQNQMSNAADLRALMSGENVMCWTPNCKKDIVRGLQVPDIPKVKAGLRIPLIMQSFYDDMISLMKTPLKIFTLKYAQLKVNLVCQDMTDKDNLMALMWLQRCTENQPRLLLIGKEQWKIEKKDGTRVPHYNIFSSDLVPAKFRAQDLGMEIADIETNDDLNISIVWGGSFETHWPNSDPAYTFKKSDKGTKAQFRLQKQFFLAMLAQGSPVMLARCWKHIEGADVASCCPTPFTTAGMFFNELLFFPTLNTMYKAWNTVARIPYKFKSDVEFEKIEETQQKNAIAPLASRRI